MTVEFHPLADQELTEAGQFYESRAPGLGIRFLDAVEAVLEILQAHPELGRPSSTTIRHLPVRRFPYSLVYRFEVDLLQILAVAHHRRRPTYWVDRVR